MEEIYFDRLYKKIYSGEQYEESDVLVDEMIEDSSYVIVLYNDDVNTFDFVIESLINICGHTLEQAQQCTLLVHYKGKCEVKEGSLEDLKPKHQALLERGLSSQIIKIE